MATVTNNITTASQFFAWDTPPDVMNKNTGIPRGKLVFSGNENITGAGAGDNDRFLFTLSLPTGYAYRMNECSDCFFSHSIGAAVLETLQNGLMVTVGLNGQTGNAGSSQHMWVALEAFANGATDDQRNPVTFGNAGGLGTQGSLVFNAANAPRSLAYRPSSFDWTIDFYCRGAAPGGTWNVRHYIEFDVFNVDQALSWGANTGIVV